MSLPSPYLSVIVTTYNWPDALSAVLRAFSFQEEGHFELIVADDGSEPETRHLVEQTKTHVAFPLRYVWHEDLGFRAAAIRNRAAAIAKGEYFIFLDGDCIPRPDFIAQHRRLMEPGFMLAGQRILLSRPLTERILHYELAAELWSLAHWFRLFRSGECNRFWPFLHMPLGPLRKIGSHRWQGVRSCNLGMWRSDFWAVNGFDEAFSGWGYEDSDLAARLLRHGTRRKLGMAATGVLHLWHPEQPRDRAQQNWERFQERLHHPRVRAEQGLDQYL